MATNDLNAPKRVPMSTAFMLSCYYLGGMLWFSVLMNCVSMLVFQWLNPRFAAKLANNEVLCGNRVRNFYTRLALKWPFKWAKWWITPDLLKNYTVEEQKIYFREVRQDEEVLWSLSPEAWAVLMRNVEPYPLKTLADGLKERNDLFEALLDLTCDRGKESELLKQYMRYGAIPKSQMEILSRKACFENADGKFDILLRILREYIERCSINKELMNKIATSDEVSQRVKDAVAESCTSYRQRMTTRRLYDLKTVEEIDEWSAFCAPNKKISALAQQEMSLNQYGIFLKHGHHLASEAIAYMLWYGNKDMAEHIFRNEPHYGILDDTIDFVLDKHEYLRPLLQEVIEETERDSKHVGSKMMI